MQLILIYTYIKDFREKGRDKRREEEREREREKERERERERERETVFWTFSPHQSSVDDLLNKLNVKI